MPVDHEFGGQHTELKLSIIEKYLRAFSSALQNKFSELWYIDAFAGTGKRTVKVEARGEDLFDAEVPQNQWSGVAAPLKLRSTFGRPFTG